MDPEVYYKTQSASYDKLITGDKLTDERIEYYARLKRGEIDIDGQPTNTSRQGDKVSNKKDKRASRRKAKQLLHGLFGLIHEDPLAD